MMKKNRVILKNIMVAMLLLATCQTMSGVPKREFRGAWIQCVNGQFQGMGTKQMQQTLTHQLDVLKADGVNAIIFQVRAECDALYESDIEPWSRFLTGVQGQRPEPYWDPLAWMVAECHKRGMELHAWINPYRAKTKNSTLLSDGHVAVKHPELVFSYGGQFILNPGLPANRDYICRVARDIVSRYDIDGFHIDDYFYPYPVVGEPIPDADTFKKNNNGIKDVGDWRRWNVNEFMRELSTTIHKTKPWVKFGVSPFGIWRNKKTDPQMGSETNGLQNYDDLYADVLMWVNNGWVDYVVPQLYWAIGNKRADYATLIRWWNDKVRTRPLFIGESVDATVKYADPENPQSSQIDAKQRLHKQLLNVSGSIVWYAKAMVDNVGNYGEAMRNNYWRYPALQPQMPFIDGKAPNKPKKLSALWTSDGYVLFWTAPKGETWNDKAHKYVVYRFARGEKVDISDVTKIVAITADTFLKLPYSDGSTKYTYVVTALDRMSNESKAAKRKVKL